MKILITRMFARGDVLVATAILPALKKKFPDAIIDFQTACPDVMVNNPYIDKLVFEVEGEYDLHIQLDMSYESRPTDNILHVYAELAGVPIQDCMPFLNCSQVNKPLLDNYVVVHAGNTNWAGRNWDKSKFKELAIRIHDAGHQIICVGGPEDYFVPSDCDVRGKTTIGQLATIMKDSRLFVGIDSFPMHVAQTFNIPSVVFFGSIRGDTRIYRQNAKWVSDFTLPCLGCHHRKQAPSVATHECETGTLDCINNVSVNQMWDAISMELFGNTESRQQESARINLYQE